MIDKDIERNRYNIKAKLLLNKGVYSNITPAYLNALSYEYYFRTLEGKRGKQAKLLEIGA